MANVALRGARFRVTPRTVPMLVALLLLVAGWFGWHGLSQWRAEATAARLECARVQALRELSAALLAPSQRLQWVLKNDRRVVVALTGGDARAAGTAIAAAMAGSGPVRLWPAALSEAYREPERFGYARLALLESALGEARALTRVVREDGQPRLGLAAPATLAQSPVVVYLSQPLRPLRAALQRVELPARAYLALRQDGYEVMHRGASALAQSAEALAQPIAGSGLRLVAAAPPVIYGPLGLHSRGCLLAAILTSVLAGLVLVAGCSRRRLPGTPDDDAATGDQTLCARVLSALHRR